jgi:hypothetical protein
MALSAAFQQNIRTDEYEVIVADNGSMPPFWKLGLTVRRPVD